jgi:glycosyltransferase involved in cell wall biosynthesis
MRTLRVVHLVEGLGTGGLERVVQALVGHADGRRFAVEVLCAVKGGAVAREIEMAGARVRILGVSAYGPRGILTAARAIRETEADLVHSHGHFAGVMGRAAAWWTGRAVAVHHLHTVDPTLEPRHLRRERFLLRLTRRVLCCSEAVARHAARDLGAPPGLLAVIPNGIDPPPPAGRDEALDRLGLKRDDGPIVGCVGGLSRHKGQSVLMQAMGQLEGGPPTLVLVGDGPDRPGLESEAATLQGRVRIRFMGERPDARSLLPAFDVLVVPSIEREGFGLAALEGMDAGLPVVASRLGGLPEVVEDGRSGLLVPPGDVRAMALAIARLLASPEERRAMGTEGRRRVESRFRAASMARRVESVYEEVLSERRAA